MAATPENGFQPFTTIGPYFPMAGGGGTLSNCPLEVASTSPVFESFSTFGGGVATVTVGSNNGWSGNIEDAMRIWWLFKGLSANITAYGKWKDFSSTPMVERDWVLSQPIDSPVEFPGVVRPNKFYPENPNNGERILNCEYQTGFAFEDQTSTSIDNRLYDSYFRVESFKINDEPSSADNPDNLLIEFFCYIEPVVEEVVSNYGLLILSTRNKDYTDVVIEGSTGGITTQMIGSRKTYITNAIVGIPTTFYGSFFILNSNLNLFTVLDWDVEILSGQLWERV